MSNPAVDFMFQSLLWWIAVVNRTSRRSLTTWSGSFNPCCGGLQSSTHGPPAHSPRHRAFQSLLWWIAVVNYAEDGKHMGTYATFQSLLWWIAVVNPLHLAGASGLALFQSLLWWIAVVNPDRSTRAGSAGPMARFNPCCGGLQSSTAAALIRELARAMFQSLLWWIAVVNANPIPGAPGRSRFQSLLWWIAVVNRGSAEPSVRSCNVSILVVVDCSRQPRRATPCQATPCVSILVVVDCSRQLRPQSIPVAFASRVSILVVVDCSRQHGTVIVYR